jgi:NAD+ kinase
MKVFIVNSKPFDEDYVYSVLKQFNIISTAFPKKADFILAIGGDAAVLKTVSLYKFGLPILAWNTGTLGFLSNNEILDDLLNKCVSYNYNINYKCLFSCAYDNTKINFLNEIAFLSHTQGKLSILDLYINDEYITTYKGDGLIISTSTGSTAWNLSAGGSIVSPDLECLLITPNNPFSMCHKPLIISKDSKIKVTGLTNIIIDGKVHGIKNDVTIFNEHKTLQFIGVNNDISFYKRLKDKLGWAKNIKGE